MSEDKEKEKENNSEIKKLKAKIATLELEKQKIDQEIYGDDYLAFKKEKKKKQQNGNPFSTNRGLTEFSKEEIEGMDLQKVVTLIAGEVYSKIKGERDSEKEKEKNTKAQEIAKKKHKEALEFAEKNPDVIDYLPRIAELEKKHPTLDLQDLYDKAKKEKQPSQSSDETGQDKVKGKEEPKVNPDTRDKFGDGFKQTDKDKTYRQIISEEYDKLPNIQQ